MNSDRNLSWYTDEKVSVKFKSKKRAIGDLGEEVARIYFELIGWQILEKNWKLYRAPELDFILLSLCKTLVFLEVKTRSFGDSSRQNFESCIDSLDLKKQKNITRAAKIFARQKFQSQNMRFDLLAISILAYSIDERINSVCITAKPENIEFIHIESAFGPHC